MNKYLDANQQLDLMVKAQTWQNLVYSGVLTQQQVKNRIAEELLTYKKIHETNANIANIEANTANINADTQGKLIDNGIKRITKNQAENTAQGIIDAINSESYMRKYQALNEGDSEKNIYYARHYKGKYNKTMMPILDYAEHWMNKISPFRNFFGKD